MIRDTVGRYVSKFVQLCAAAIGVAQAAWVAQWALDHPTPNAIPPPVNVTSLVSRFAASYLLLHIHTNRLWFSKPVEDEVPPFIPGLHEVFVSLVKHAFWGACKNGNQKMLGPRFRELGSHGRMPDRTPPRTSLCSFAG